jgi:hypothetical protein
LLIDLVFPSVRGLSEVDVEKLYQDYAKTYGDSEAPKVISAHHGFWELVGQRPKTNEFCGTFSGFMGCDKVELHGRSHLDGEVHAGEVFTRKVYRSCHSPRCSVCCFSGWAKREAEKVAQRIEVASKRFGLPQHVIVSPPESDWGLAEFHNGEYLAKVKKLLNVRGFVGGCSIFHGFSYADYYESVSKGVLYGWRWHPHVHCIAFLLDGYGKCRRCSKLGRASVATCAGCDGFESVTRRCYVDDKTIVKVKDERITIFGTAWYQLNHSSIKVVF